MTLLLAFSRAIDLVNEKMGRAMSWAILAAVVVSSVNAIVRYALNTSSNAWLELQWYLFGAVFLLGAAYTFKQNGHIRIDIVNARLSPTARNVIELIGHVFFLPPFAGLLAWLSVSNAWRAFSPRGAVTLPQIGFLAALILCGLLVWAGAVCVKRLWRGDGGRAPVIGVMLLVGAMLIADLYAIVALKNEIGGLWEYSSSAGGLPTWPARFLIPLGFISLFFQGLSELIKRIGVMRGEISDPHAAPAGAHGSVQ